MKKKKTWSMQKKIKFEMNESCKCSCFAFTHPRDKYEGLLSDWMDENKNIKES